MFKLERVKITILVSDDNKNAFIFMPQKTLASPATRRLLARREPKEGECSECFQTGKDFLIFDHRGVETQRIETLWIGCSLKKGSKYICSQRVHADCLGFPGVDEDDIKKMPDWFCKLDRKAGRDQSFAVAHRHEETSDDSELMRPPSAPPKKGKKLFTAESDGDSSDSSTSSHQTRSNSGKGTGRKGKSLIRMAEDTWSKVLPGNKKK
jgi:hypothetical protein